MKKIFKGIMAQALTFTSVFAVAGCGKDDSSDTEPETWEISKETWESWINPNAFQLRATNSSAGDLSAVNYVNGYYEITYQVNSHSSETTSNYIKETNGTETLYYELEYSLGDYTKTETTEDEYNADIKPYLDLVSFVKNNYSKFTKGYERWSGAIKGYTYDIATLKQEVPSIVSWNLTEFGVGKFSSLSGESDYIQLHLKLNDDNYEVKFKGFQVPYYIGSTMIDNIDSYTIVNDSNDDNRITLEVDSTGFHAITATQDVYFKDNGDDTYTQYLKNGNSYDSGNITEYNYNSYYDQFVTKHIGNLLDVGNANNLDYEEGDFTLTDKEKTVGRYDCYFTNIKFNLDENGVLETITWDYKVYDKQMNYDFPVYQVTLTPNTTITYPTVG